MEPPFTVKSGHLLPHPHVTNTHPVSQQLPQFMHWAPFHGLEYPCGQPRAAAPSQPPVPPLTGTAWDTAMSLI